MNFSNDQHLAILMKMNMGYAFHQAVFNESGEACDYIFLEVNPYFEEITVLKKTDIIGKKVTQLEIESPIASSKIISVFGSVAQTGEEKTIELYFKSTNKRYTVSVYCPEPGYFCTIYEDVTSLYQIRKEFEITNRQLIDKNRELEQIVYVTSHDLRSPLVNIQGFTRELELSIDDLKNILKKITLPENLIHEIEIITQEELPESIDFIKSGINKMDILQKGLLSISRLGRIHPEICNLNMNKLISEVAMNFEYKIKELDIDLQIAELPDCRADISLLNQVFSNLLENAIKYRDLRRKCSISICGEVQKNYVVYKISDNGIGVKKENQEKIFEIFYRDKSEQSGEGLGLTLVKKAVEKQGGLINIESETGKGTTFSISIPR